MEGFLAVLTALPWFAWIAIVVIAGGSIRQAQKARHEHLERMELIAQGFDPRLPPGEDE
jgi:hypothetical protein